MTALTAACDVRQSIGLQSEPKPSVIPIEDAPAIVAFASSIRAEESAFLIWTLKFFHSGPIARAMPDVEHKHLPFSDHEQNPVAAVEELAYFFLVVRSFWSHWASKREGLEA